MIPIRDSVKSIRPPVITVALILVNAAVFIYEIMLPEQELEQLFHLWGVVPARYTHPAEALKMGYPETSFLPFFTSIFLHGGWLHLISNMWALWIFGDNVEDRMGHVRYFLFYVICGILAGVVNFAIHPHVTLPTIGASGAIAGVMGAYFFLYPLARIIVLVPIFFYPLFLQIPAIVYLFFWFLTQFWSGTLTIASGRGDFGGVAFWAHIGGFIAGIFLFRYFLKFRKRPSR